VSAASHTDLTYTTDPSNGLVLFGHTVSHKTCTWIIKISLHLPVVKIKLAIFFAANNVKVNSFGLKLHFVLLLVSGGLGWVGLLFKPAKDDSQPSEPEKLSTSHRAALYAIVNSEHVSLNSPWYHDIWLAAVLLEPSCWSL